MRTQARSSLYAPTAITCAQCQAGGHGPSHSRRVSLTPHFLAIAVGIAAIVTTTARAEVIAPAGLAPGDTFQLVFVTSTQTTATNTDMAYYDNFVNTLADAAGLGTYNGAPVTWLDLGSTSAVSATSREPTTDTAPIYTLNGAMVAKNATQLWSQYLSNPIDIDEKGAAIGIPTLPAIVWTGGYLTPLPGRPSGGPLGPGETNATTYGVATSVNITEWWGYDITNATFRYNLYAISPILTVQDRPTETPEPAAMAVLGVGLAGLAVARRRKRPLGSP